MLVGYWVLGFIYVYLYVYWSMFNGWFGGGLEMCKYIGSRWLIGFRLCGWYSRRKTRDGVGFRWCLSSHSSKLKQVVKEGENDDKIKSDN